MGKLVLRYRDAAGNTSTAAFPTADLTAGNITAQATLRANLISAIAGICNGVLAYTGHLAVATVGSTSNAAAGNFRFNKWLVRWHATGSGKGYRTEIPVGDAAVVPAGTYLLDLTQNPGLQFKTDFEAMVVGEDGTAAIIDSVTYIPVQF